MSRLTLRLRTASRPLPSILQEVSKAVGGDCEGHRDFVRFETGEGLEKKQEDFAAEVAAQMNA